MSLSIDFSEKTVVVIGATSGINLGIAKTFAKMGANVVVASRTQEKVDKAVADLIALGAKAMGFVADVRDIEAVQAGMAKAHAMFGDFDTLISGAAGNFPAFASDMSSNAFKSVVDIDLLGTFHVMNSAYSYLKKPGASVINISAPQAYLPMQAQSHVCAAKAGVDMVTKSLALEWAGDGIRVNSVVPGPIADTEGMKRLAPTPELLTMTEDSVPLKRLGNTDDIGQTCAFLASPIASYITGTIIPVDGGWSLGGASALGNSLAGLLKK